jgi:hypothetical protein
MNFRVHVNRCNGFRTPGTIHTARRKRLAYKLSYMILIQKPDINEMENHDVDPTGARLAVQHPRLTRPSDITKETDHSLLLNPLRVEEN